MSASAVLALMGCGASRVAAKNPRSASSTTTLAAPTTFAVNAQEAVTRWLGHLATHNDAAAFADLAPGSRAAVGDLANYERGSGRFGAVYAPFAAPAAEVIEVLSVSQNLTVVTVRAPGDGPGAVIAIPVRRSLERWQVDPILDAGSYSVRPESGATVEPQPTVMVQLDDRATQARVWFDDREGGAVTSTSFRSQRRLPPGWHVVTIVLVRGKDVAARILTLQVA